MNTGTWTSHQLLQVIQQSKAFLVGNRGEGIIWVDVLQTGDQVGQGVVGSKCVHLGDDTTCWCFKLKCSARDPVSVGSHRVLQLLPSPNGFKLPDLLALHAPDDHPLQVDRVSLVQPDGTDGQL